MRHRHVKISVLGKTCREISIVLFSREISFLFYLNKSATHLVFNGGVCGEGVYYIIYAYYISI